MVSTRSFGKGRRSWTSLGNPYRPLISDKSSSVNTERGFDIHRKDTTLKWRGGLVKRPIGGIDKTLAPNTDAGRLLSDTSLLVLEPFHFLSNSYSSFER
ncbi:hypothetical protein TIFTF001_028435 [Ficus carica]|uniref:Uncharacterized protein n=1 Tax=Ficus carica TaxID=3494 RepID=A0AA88DPX0_FICCA|nr:hypothetical protein TIFTF001_028435 [Ficus carica]